MFIQRLMIQNFRNLSCLELETVPGFNLICGPNGAGKTSVLEAINYLALGRSFRQSSNQYLIQQGQSTLSIYAQIQEDLNAHAVQTTIGMSRTRGDELMIKINSDSFFRLIDLIDHICVQVIHPQGIELITKDSEGRRSFIDWGVYYSDESFKQLWWDYRKALKQRNALLRQNTMRYKPRVQRYVDSYYAQKGSHGTTLEQSANYPYTLSSSNSSNVSSHSSSSSSNSQSQSVLISGSTFYNANGSSGQDSSSSANYGAPYRGNTQSTYQLQDSFNIQDLSPVLQSHLHPELNGQNSGYQDPVGLGRLSLALQQGSGAGAVSNDMQSQGLGSVDCQVNKPAYQGQPLQDGEPSVQNLTQTVRLTQNAGVLLLEGHKNSSVDRAEGDYQAKVRQGFNRLWSSPLSEFEIWNEQIADLSEKITARRLNYLEDLRLVLQEILDQFLPNFKLKFELYFGWDKGLDLRGQLAQNLEKERGLGYTLYGCHRADLKIKNYNLAAGATLSRGQLKMLVYAMRLAQGILLKQQTQRSCIYLIDDLNSELDEDSQRRLLNTLLECQHQVFISNIQSDFRNNLIPHGRTDIKVFNLDQGRLID